MCHPSLSLSALPCAECKSGAFHGVAVVYARIVFCTEKTPNLSKTLFYSHSPDSLWVLLLCATEPRSTDVKNSIIVSLELQRGREEEKKA